MRETEREKYIVFRNQEKYIERERERDKKKCSGIRKKYREREEEREIGSANRYKVLFLTPL